MVGYYKRAFFLPRSHGHHVGGRKRVFVDRVSEYLKGGKRYYLYIVLLVLF